MEHYSQSFSKRLLEEAGISEGMRVLDVGCGPGDMALLASLIVGPTGLGVGVDRNTTLLAMAEKRAVSIAHAPVFRQADITALPVDLTAFDAVIGRRVLMYQTEPVKVLGLLAGRLVPEGVMVFQEADLSMVPARIESLPLHESVLGW